MKKKSPEGSAEHFSGKLWINPPLPSFGSGFIAFLRYPFLKKDKTYLSVSEFFRHIALRQERESTSRICFLLRAIKSILRIAVFLIPSLGNQFPIRNIFTRTSLRGFIALAEPLGISGDFFAPKKALTIFEASKPLFLSGFPLFFDISEIVCLRRKTSFLFSLPKTEKIH